jgi:glutamate racemase
VSRSFSSSGPIGVFDSGIGGLTVLKALVERFPAESYVYIGDTARLPYGTKSPETVIRYSRNLTHAVLQHNVKAVVVACNTASTHALEEVKAVAAPIPVIGMIEPAAKAALAVTKNNRIGIIATSGTVRSGAYTRQLQELRPEVEVFSQPCQMLVALAEEGWSSGDITESVIRRYLDPLFQQSSTPPDTLILGCTHFPVFEPLLREILGEEITLINSGKAAAESLATYIPVSTETGSGALQFFATDDPHRFADNAAKFFDHRLSYQDVQIIDVTG